MKLGTIFLTVVSLITGYVLWSYAIITPRWTTQPGFPLAEPGRTIRLLSIVLIIAVVFVINFALHKFSDTKSTTRTVLNAIIAANIALAFTLVLSQILDSTFTMPSPLMYDTLGYLGANTSVLFFIIIVINFATLAAVAAGWVVTFAVNKALGKPTDTDPNADADS